MLVASLFLVVCLVVSWLGVCGRAGIGLGECGVGEGKSEGCAERRGDVEVKHSAGVQRTVEEHYVVAHFEL